MTFKDTVEADIKNVFINFDEFAAEHTINGKKILAVTDDDQTTERALKDVNNIYYGSKLLYVSAADLGFRPVVGNNLRLDGGLFTVVNVVESMGVYEITAAAYNGR